MEKSTETTKKGLAQMLKGGVIMDVVNAEHARIAEDAGAVAVAARRVRRQDEGGAPAAAGACRREAARKPRLALVPGGPGRDDVPDLRYAQAERHRRSQAHTAVWHR